MKNVFFLMLNILFVQISFSQNTERYENKKGELHLCGTLEIEELEKDAVFQEWFTKNYLEYKVSNKKRNWAKKLSDVQVDIYLGTWCGDSRQWVPKFIRLWDELGLKRSQLKFTALYEYIEGKYKQGPNGEEQHKDIHRLPTFIFKREGKEIARIVESPNKDLETDLAQIAKGTPLQANYRGAARMTALLKSNSNERLKNDENYLNEVGRLIKSPSELNTLGYVYLESGRIEEALTIFYYNTLLYKNKSIVYESYAVALAKSSQEEEAIRNYEKVLSLDKKNDYAREQIKKLKHE